MYIFDSNEQKMKDLNKQMCNNKEKKNTTIVFFLAPWCRHCNDFKPTMHNIMSRFENSNMNGVMAAVYEKEIPQLRYKKEINGYPTISLFKNGQYQDYKGSREEKPLSEFLFDVFKKNKALSDIKKKKSKKKERKKNLKKGKKVLKRIRNGLRKQKQSGGTRKKSKRKKKRSGKGKKTKRKKTKRRIK
tara:strand:- start:11280 stop:11843 length:564 start_codon:yes stop_codon:yes gene_type:complete